MRERKEKEGQSEGGGGGDDVCLNEQLKAETVERGHMVSQ